MKKANQNKVKVDSYPTNSSSQKKDTSTSGKNNNSSSKSNTSKSDSKKDTSSKSESSKQESSKSESSKTPQSSSSSSKPDSSKNESSKPTPKPQHTHSWTNITEKVKVVDKEAYTYEERCMKNTTGLFAMTVVRILLIYQVMILENIL